MTIKMKSIYLLFILILIAGVAQAVVDEERAHQLKISTRTEVNGQVFIELALKGQNNVFIKISDPTAQAELRIAKHLKEALIAKGYKVAKTPETANYIMQGNIIESGEVSPELLKKAYSSPFGAKFIELDNNQKDPITQAVGFLFNKAKGKSYAIIADFKLTQKIKVSPKKIRTVQGRCRVITGTGGCHAGIKAAMAKLRDDFKKHIVSYF
jgi:hypothetical protein